MPSEAIAILDANFANAGMNLKDSRNGKRETTQH